METKPHIDDLSFEIPQVLRAIEEENKEEEELNIPIPGQTIQDPMTTTGWNENETPAVLKVPSSRRQLKALLRKLGMKARSMS